MNDYNFFESYQVKKNKGNKPVIIILTIFFLLLLMTIGGIIGTKMVLNEEIDEMSAILNQEENQATLNRIEEKERLKEQLNAIKQDLTMAPTLLEVENPIVGALLDNIANALPADAEITDMAITQEMITISGKAAIPSAVAEFQHNLRAVLEVEDIAVSNIQLVEENITETELEGDAVGESFYAFSMTITMRGLVE
ncbi:MAG: hypothetical protein CVU98_04255 [Firmicutes bacterium HGW-Firmicutes-3]|jgi:Tfp pilus assembly protein PilN|nr:MAG: hypothetical protein CVU98_04255 [Firmicutes bacterium HGW-Firmicutes-3]